MLLLPLSKDAVQLEALRRLLAVYRMVFGQLRQDDLLAYLLEHVPRGAIERRMGICGSIWRRISAGRRRPCRDASHASESPAQESG